MHVQIRIALRHEVAAQLSGLHGVREGCGLALVRALATQARLFAAAKVFFGGADQAKQLKLSRGTG